MKKALITGITGQDGSYLAEFLLSKDYEVHGLSRVLALEDPEARFSRIVELVNDKKITVHHGDVSDYPTVWRLIAQIKPDEVYHLAAVSSIKNSFEDDFGTFKTNTHSTHYLLSAIKELAPSAKFYFAGSSEMFGHPKITPQDENTPFNPVSPYAISKLAGLNLVKMYRDSYGIFACTGIAYNHESPRRGFEFVTRKITRTAAKIKLGLEKELRIGSLDSRRDWGYSGDFVRAMWLMLQAEKPDDYIIGTGENHTVGDLVKIAFGRLGLDWEKCVVIDPQFVRPKEDFEFRANPTKIKSVLGWSPKIKFEDMVGEMVESDLKLLSR